MRLLAYIFDDITKPEFEDQKAMDEMIEGVTCSDLRGYSHIMSNAVMSRRQVGELEAAMILGGIPLYHCTASSVFTDTCLPEKRVRALKQSRTLEENVSERLFYINLFDHSSCRLLESFSNEVKLTLKRMTLFERCSWFVQEIPGALVREIGENCDEDDVNVLDDEEIDQCAVQENSSLIIVNKRWRKKYEESPFTSVEKNMRLVVGTNARFGVRRKFKEFAFSIRQHKHLLLC